MSFLSTLCKRAVISSSRFSASASLSSTSTPIKQQFRSFSATASSPELKVKLSRPFVGHKIEVPGNVSITTKEEVLELYRQMTYYRRFEIVADTMYKQRLIRGFCHLYDGQEAVLVGMEAVLKRSDSVITSYRDHCHQIARGDTGDSVMAELFGKSTGCSKGKGGSMHLYFPKNNFFGGNGIVGAQVPLGAGLAFAHKYRKDGGVAVAAYGDGAANQGQLFEAANMAALWKLPMIFLCENNEYGMGTSTKRASASTQFYTRGDYIPGIWVDGMDVFAVKEAFKFATEYCRSGKGPIFMEASTYRYHGHSMSDPGISYRSRDEVSNMRSERDCIERVRNLIKENNFASEVELKKMEKEIRVSCDAAVEFAKNSQELPPERLFTEVYVDELPPYIRTPDFRQSVVTQK